MTNLTQCIEWFTVIFMASIQFFEVSIGLLVVIIITYNLLLLLLILLTLQPPFVIVIIIIANGSDMMFTIVAITEPWGQWIWKFQQHSYVYTHTLKLRPCLAPNKLRRNRRLQSRYRQLSPAASSSLSYHVLVEGLNMAEGFTISSNWLISGVIFFLLTFHYFLPSLSELTNHGIVNRHQCNRL